MAKNGLKGLKLRNKVIVLGARGRGKAEYQGA